MDATPQSAPVAAEPERVGGMPLFLFIRGIFMLTVMTTIVVAAHWYIGLRLINAPGVPAPYSTLAWAGIWVAFASIFLGLAGRTFLPRAVARVFQWVGFMWMGAFGLLFTSVMLSDAIRFVLAHTVLVPTAQWPLIQAAGVLVVVVPALLYGLYVAARPVVETVEVGIKGLSPALDGFKVVQISDVHIGETLGKRFMRRVVEQVNALKPDIVAVTGDLIDGSVEKLRSEVEPLGEIQGRYGRFYVTGNHEFYSGADSWEAEVARLGLTVLHNSHAVVRSGDGELVVGGVPDVEGHHFAARHQPDVTKTFEGAPAGVPRLLLAHQPRFAKHAAGHDIALQLSGHTHGGQIFPFMFLVRLQQPVIAGLRTLWGVPVYTNRGTGYWGPPFRIGASGEISELILRRV